MKRLVPRERNFFPKQTNFFHEQMKLERVLLINFLRQKDKFLADLGLFFH